LLLLFDLPFAVLPFECDADFLALGLAPASIDAREKVRTKATNNERVLSLRSDPDILTTVLFVI
jgi:hypothetical protein